VDGHVTGDVERATVQPVAGAMTLVPGGVGPVTNAVLLRHHLTALRAS
jgi:methylenetetrahydrofolate dehydrogenase (NADP+)/methenyltetrahydrofolate cyclohydrolase